MKWFLQVLNTPNNSSGNSASIIVHFDSGRYLINCAEGTQRLCNEQKVRLINLRGLFMTQMHWRHFGGLPGMLLTIADAGVSKLDIVGGPNVTHGLVSTRHFLLRSSISINTHEMHTADDAYKDENLTVTPIHIYPDGYSQQPSTADSYRSNGGKQDNSYSNGAGPGAVDPAEIRRLMLSQMFSPKKQQSNSSDKPQSSCKGAQIEAEIMAQEGEAQTDVLSGTKEHDASGSQSAFRIQQSQPGTIRSVEHALRQSANSSVTLPRTDPTPVIVCYIFRGPVVPGKFNVEAAKALGIPPGPLYSRLHSGHDVTLEDGRVIQPHQVVGAPKPPSIFLVIDCPSAKYINSLVTSPQWQGFYSSAARNPDSGYPALIIHLAGEGVLEDPRYIDWMRRFDFSTQHIVCSQDYCGDGNPYQKHAALQANLARLDSSVFVVPQGEPAPKRSIAELATRTGLNIVAAQPLMRYELEPRARLNAQDARQLKSPEQFESEVEEAPALANYLRLVDEYKANDTQTTDGEGPPGLGDAECNFVVSTLGTGSAIPSIMRNVSCNLIYIPENGGCAVLDAGEGSVGQIKRLLGYPERNARNTKIPLSYAEFVLSLRLVYVSHLHADHHLGAIQLIADWTEITNQNGAVDSRLTILAPARFQRWLRDISGAQSLSLHRINFISCDHTKLPLQPTKYPIETMLGRPPRGPLPPTVEVAQHIEDLKASLGLTNVDTCDVVHCPWAYGLSLTHRSGWRLVYSGDTRPCATLVQIAAAHGSRPTMMLHEATLEDSLLLDAIKKRHSTTSEAIAVANHANSATLLLTHFSQRYLGLASWKDEAVKAAHVPGYTPIALPRAAANSDEIALDLNGLDGDAQGETSGLTMPVASAFDMMVVGPRDIQRFQRMRPALRALFYEQMMRDMAEEQQQQQQGGGDSAKSSKVGKGGKKQKGQNKKSTTPSPSQSAAQTDTWAENGTRKRVGQQNFHNRSPTSKRSRDNENGTHSKDEGVKATEQVGRV